MIGLAQGDSPLPEWAGDLPPWAQVAIAVIVGGPALLAAVVGVLTAFDKLRRRGDDPAPPEDETGRPAPVNPELRRASSEMDRVISLLEESQRQDHAQIAALEAQLAGMARMQEQLRDQLRDRDQTIALLRQTLDQVLGRPRETP